MVHFYTIETKDLDTVASYRLITSCVLPRPIAWITTQNSAGLVNVAPFSSYNYIAHTPPMVAINIASRGDALKDTARNILESREFVINVPTESDLESLNKTSADYPETVSEAELHEIALLPSNFVAPPRISTTPIQLECRLNQVLPLGSGINTLYIGEVLAFHLNEEIFDGQHVDVTKIRPIVRLAGPHYATLGEIVRLSRNFSVAGSLWKEDGDT